ncbi:hypothetical protein [Brevibacillus reuszeri]|nr:hypothetical protein [Brevibacillus reuszeri]
MGCYRRLGDSVRLALIGIAAHRLDKLWRTVSERGEIRAGYAALGAF